jgi:Hypervirulence associated proteins TUDOR domain
MTNSKGFIKGQAVTWDLGSGVGQGTIQERYERKVIRRLKHGLVTRYGTPENPAYLIRQTDGDEVLRMGSELTATV